MQRKVCIYKESETKCKYSSVTTVQVYPFFQKKKIEHQWKKQEQERCEENEKNEKKKDAQA